MAFGPFDELVLRPSKKRKPKGSLTAAPPGRTTPNRYLLFLLLLRCDSAHWRHRIRHQLGRADDVEISELRLLVRLGGIERVRSVGATAASQV